MNIKIRKNSGLCNEKAWYNVYNGILIKYSKHLKHKPRVLYSWVTK